MVGVFLGVEAFVGDVNQLIGLVTIVGKSGDTVIHADADGQIHGLQGFGKDDADTPTEIDGLSRIRLGEDQGEFVAAGAKGKIGSSQSFLQGGGGRLKDLIAARMSMLVVDFLEAVEVENDQSEGMPVTAGAVEFFLKSLAKEAAVVKAGEGISDGAELQLLEILVFNQNRKAKNTSAGEHVHQSSLERKGPPEMLVEVPAMRQGVIPELSALVLRKIDVGDYFEIALEELSARRKIQAFERVGQQLEIGVLNR